MKKQSEWLLILLISLVLAVAAAVISEAGALRGLTDRESYEKKTEVESVLLTGTGRVTILFSDASEDNPGRYIHRLKLQLFPQEEKPLNLVITVWRSDPENGNETISQVLEDCNPLYVKTEILKLDLEHVTSVELETEDRSGFSIGSVEVDNQFCFNWYLAVFVFFTAFSLLYDLRFLLCMFREKEHAAPEEGIRRMFTVSALCLGAALTFCLPAGKVGYDEETHLQAVLELASFPSGELHISEGLMNQVTVTEYNNPSAQPGGAAEQDQLKEKLSEACDYKQGSKTPEFSVPASRIPAYLTMAAAVKLGKGLNLSWPLLLFLARTANLLTYVFLISFALKILPCGHVLMALIALFPQNLFLASTVSYDPFVTGCLFAGMAYVLKLMESSTAEGRSFIRDLLPMGLFFLLGSLPKAVYAPLFLLAVLIPFRRCVSRRQKNIFIAGILAAVLLLLAIFILPTLLSPSQSGDIRGGAVSEASQLDFIISNPLTYTKILLSQMIRWIPQCFFGADCTTFMAHLVNGSTGYRGPVAAVWFLLFVTVAAGILTVPVFKRKPFLRLGERVWFLLIVAGVSALIWTAMYVAFTEPGAATIAGVQGRYFIPLLFPLYFALGGELPAGRLLVWKEDLWYYSIVFGITAAGSLEFFQAVVLPYCL